MQAPGDKPVAAPYKGPMKPPVGPPPEVVTSNHPGLLNKPMPGLIPLGITKSVGEINHAVERVDAGHRQAFGVPPSPGMIFDVVRGWSRGAFQNIDDLFTNMPTSSRDLRANLIAETHPKQPSENGFAPEPGKDLVATDPGAGAAIAKAQGHPLTPQQVEALKVAQGKEGLTKMHQNLVKAGVLPSVQVVHDAPFSWLFRGAAITAKGLVLGLPELAIGEYKAAVQSVGTSRYGPVVQPHPVVEYNKQVVKGIAVKTYDDFKAVITGDTQYLKDHPEAIWNVLLVSSGGYGAVSGFATRVSAGAAAARAAGEVTGSFEESIPALRQAIRSQLANPVGESIVFKGAGARATQEQVNELVSAAKHLSRSKKQGVSYSEAIKGVQSWIRDRHLGEPLYPRTTAFAKEVLRPKPPAAPKSLLLPGDRDAAQVQALQFEDPLHRWTDNMITAARQHRALQGKEPVAAEALRAFGINSAADFISRAFSFQAKFKREYLAQQRTSNAMAMYLAHQLDGLTSTSIDTADALKSIPEVEKGNLTIGELKALHVMMQGGDWREAMATMVGAHRDWRTAAANTGSAAEMESHTVQLAALKLAKDVLEKADNGEISKAFGTAVPLFTRAANELTRMKVEYLGLDPELAAQRNDLEYEIYKGGKIPDRKKLATLMRTNQKNYDRLAAKKGPVTPELKLAHDDARRALAETLDKIKVKESASNKSGLASMQKKAERQKASLEDLKAQIKEQQQVEHPDLAAAGKRIAGLQRTIDRVDARLANMEHREGATRVPLKTRRTKLTGSRVPEGRVRAGTPEYLPQTPGEISHALTGKSVVAGDININIVNLLAKEIAATVRTINRLDDYGTKMKASYMERPTGPIGEFFAPMRTSEELPEKWRRLVNKTARREPHLTEEEAASLTEEEIDSFNSHVYGFTKDKKSGEWFVQDAEGKPTGQALGQNVKGIRWYDGRAFEDRMDREADGWQKIFSAGYNVTGRAKIFLAPRYILNTFSNKAMLTIAQGPWAPISLLASYAAHRIYDEETVGRIDVQVGSSRARSYQPTTAENFLSKGLTKTANFWHIVTDQHDRRAAFLFRAWQEGFKTPAEMRTLMTEDGNLAKLSEITRKAEKDVVELGNLTWNERQYMRHLLFVYPWRSRQVLWSLRTAMEHPMLDLILAQISENVDEGFKENNPFWMQQTLKHYQELGYVVTGLDAKGDPIGVDAGRINTFSGLFDVLYPSSIQQDLGPGAQFVVEAVIGKDSRGADFKGGLAHKIFSAFIDTAVIGLPQVQAYQRGSKKQPTLAPFNIADKQSELARIRSAKNIVALSPGWLNGYGLLFSGGATERSINRWKLLYNYYSSLSPEDRNKFEQKLVLDVVNHQGELLHRPVPQRVKTAIGVAAETTFRSQQLAKKQGFKGGLPDAMHDEVLVGVLKGKGLVSDQMLAQDKGYQAALKATKDKTAQPTDHADLRSYLMIKYGGAKELHQWDHDIKTLASYTKDGFAGKIARLHSLGLYSGNVTTSQDRLYDVGRRVVEYEAKVRDFTTKIHQEVDPVKKAQLKLDEATYYANEAETPLKLGGKTFPSLSRLSIADLPDKQRVAKVQEIATQSWTSMSPLEKALLGHNPDPEVALDWAAIKLQMAKEHAVLQPGETLASRGLPPTSYYVQGLAAKSKAFAADVKFSQQPLAVRLAGYKPIKESKYADYWQAFLGTIDERAQQYAKVYVSSTGKPNWAAAEKDWAKAVPYMQGWVDQQPQGFQDEVAAYVAHNPRFLYKLVRP